MRTSIFSTIALSLAILPTVACDENEDPTMDTEGDTGSDDLSVRPDIGVEPTKLPIDVTVPPDEGGTTTGDDGGDGPRR